MKRVELADGALEVLLADLVVGRRHSEAWFQPVRRLFLRVHQDLRAARRSARRMRRSLAARRAPVGVALVWRNLSAWTYTSEAGLRMMSASRRDSRNSCGPSKSRMRMRTEPSPAVTWASEPAPPTIRYFSAKRTASSLKDEIATRGLKTSIASTSSSTSSRCS